MKKWKLISIASLVILIVGITTPELHGADNPSPAASPGIGSDKVIVRVYYPDLDMAHKVFISF